MKKILLILTLIMALCVPAQAAILDFIIQPPTAGIISYAGDDSPLLGSLIEVDGVVGLDTPLHNNTFLPLSNTFLNFTTGNFDSAGTNNWVFQGGGSITVTGLLAGTFTSAEVVTTGDSFKVVIAGFTDTKTGEILSYYGVGSSGWIGGLNLSFAAAGDPPGAFASTNIFSGNVVNTPLPPTLLLLGTGLLGIVGLGFRRKKS